MFLRSILTAGALAAPLSFTIAQDSARLEKLGQENQDLKKRLETLEAIAQREGILPSGVPAAKLVAAKSSVILSGFVQASYFYNSNRPVDKQSDGYLWNTRHNSFSINKFKLTIASPPVERTGDHWDAGYKVSFIFGEDAAVVNTGGETQSFEGLREAFVELNAPVGTGLNIRAGQLISLLNYESGDGGAVNANFSQGYQWFYTGNPPGTGVQLGYTLTDWVEVKARIQNGMLAGSFDNNDGKLAMGSVNLKPMKDLWVNLIGFGGDYLTGVGVVGGSVLAGYDFTPKFHTGFEFDYFALDPDAGGSSKFWSIGGWAGYDFTEKTSLGFRAEYLGDPDGAGVRGVTLPGRASSGIFSPDTDGDLSSLTLTLTYKPLPNVRVQPEIRYDHTAYKGGFDGHRDRVFFGAGISYLF